jgi:hypothetical protein
MTLQTHHLLVSQIIPGGQESRLALNKHFSRPNFTQLMMAVGNEIFSGPEFPVKEDSGIIYVRTAPRAGSL